MAQPNIRRAVANVLLAITGARSAMPSISAGNIALADAGDGPLAPGGQDLALDLPLGLVPAAGMDLDVTLDEAPGHDLDGLRRVPHRLLPDRARIFSVGDQGKLSPGLVARLGQRQHHGVADREVDLLAVDARNQSVGLGAARLHDQLQAGNQSVRPSVAFRFRLGRFHATLGKSLGHDPGILLT